MEYFWTHPLDGEVKMIRYIQLTTPAGTTNFQASPETLKAIMDLIMAEPISVDVDYADRSIKEYYSKQFATLQYGEISFSLKRIPGEDIWKRRKDEGRDPLTGERLPSAPPPAEPLQIEAPLKQIEDQTTKPAPDDEPF